MSVVINSYNKTKTNKVNQKQKNNHGKYVPQKPAKTIESQKNASKSSAIRLPFEGALYSFFSSYSIFQPVNL